MTKGRIWSRSGPDVENIAHYCVTTACPGFVAVKKDGKTGGGSAASSNRSSPHPSDSVADGVRPIGELTEVAYSMS